MGMKTWYEFVYSDMKKRARLKPVDMKKGYGLVYRDMKEGVRREPVGTKTSMRLYV